MAGIMTSEVVLTIRTWAVWRRDRAVGLALGAVLLGALIWSVYGGIQFSKSLKFSPPPYAGFRGCFIVAGSDILRIQFIILAGLDIIVLIMMVISAFRSFTRGDNNKFSTIIHRDGILFYIYLLCVTVLNVICLNASPSRLEFMVTPLCAVLYSVLTCRIVLNIRDLSRQDAMNAPTELLSYYETDTILLPMAFLSGVNPHDGPEDTIARRWPH